MATIKINGVTYPEKKRAVLPGPNGEPLVFELPEEPDAALNGYSENAVQNKVIHAAIQDVRQRQTSPYNFKGAVATLADLPSTGQEVNDTYYVEALKYRVTWTGEAWQQSSMDESDYEDELAEVKSALNSGMVNGISDFNDSVKVAISGKDLPSSVAYTLSNGSRRNVNYNQLDQNGTSLSTEATVSNGHSFMASVPVGYIVFVVWHKADGTYFAYSRNDTNKVTFVAPTDNNDRHYWTLEVRREDATQQISTDSFVTPYSLIIKDRTDVIPNIVARNTMRADFFSTAGKSPAFTINTADKTFRIHGYGYVVYKNTRITATGLYTYDTSDGNTLLFVYDISDASLKFINYINYDKSVHAVVFVFNASSLPYNTEFRDYVYVVDGVTYNHCEEYARIRLDSDMRAPLTLTGDTILDGNGYAIDIGVHLCDDMDEFSGGVLSVPVSADNETHLYKVFVNNSEPMQSRRGVYTYNTVTVYAVSADTMKSVSLTPVLTVSELESIDRSFTYDGTNLYVHIEDTSDFVSIVMCNDDENSFCLYSNGHKIIARNVRFLFAGDSNAYVTNADYEFEICEFAYSKSNCGLQTDRSSGVARNCIAHHVPGDGFNYHDGYNHVTEGCSGYFCGDDGISHHEEDTQFLIVGGEWHHCGKGGIASPAAGSFGEIHDVYCHHNRYGILAPYRHSNAPSNQRNVLVFNPVLSDNDVGLQTAYFMLVKGAVYQQNTIDKSKTSAEYGSGSITEF